MRGPKHAHTSATFPQRPLKNGIKMLMLYVCWAITLILLSTDNGPLRYEEIPLELLSR